MTERDWFNKPASSWTIDDINGLAQAEEGVYLEFKKASEFLDHEQFSPELFSTEIAETVSAFLNSEGGILLLGVQTIRQGQTRGVELLKPTHEWIPDETFEQRNITLTSHQVRDRIYGNIMPKPFGIEVESITVPINSTTTTIFVVSVPASNLGAHQSLRTLRYYRRDADGDVPMLDYEIRDVGARKAGPLLYLACGVTKDTMFEGEWKRSSTQTEAKNIAGEMLSHVNLLFSVTNTGRGTANIIRFDVGIPTPWTVVNYSPEGTNAGAEWVPDSDTSYVLGRHVSVVWLPEKCPEIPPRAKGKRLLEQPVAWQRVIYNGNQPPASPVWPSIERIIIGVLELRIQSMWDSPTWCWLPWRIFTEGMPETRGAILLKGISGRFEVNNYEVDDVGWAGGTEDELFITLRERFEVP